MEQRHCESPIESVMVIPPPWEQEDSSQSSKVQVQRAAAVGTCPVLLLTLWMKTFLQIVGVLENSKTGSLKNETNSFQVSQLQKDRKFLISSRMVK